VIDRFDAPGLARGREAVPEVLRFPPIFSATTTSASTTSTTSPTSWGSLHTFTGGEREHRDMLGKFERKENWTENLAPARVMMTPAICYPLYPSLANTTLPADGPPRGPAGLRLPPRAVEWTPRAMQIFRMHEYVRLGTPGQALEHRAFWLDKARRSSHRWD
jgi:hypothetical protein